MDGNSDEQSDVKPPSAGTVGDVQPSIGCVVVNGGHGGNAEGLHTRRSKSRKPAGWFIFSKLLLECKP